MSVYREKGKITEIVILNAAERIPVRDIQESDDSLLVEMPFFESVFRLKKNKDLTWEGEWSRTTASGMLKLPFVATPSDYRYRITEKYSNKGVEGRWKVVLTRSNNSQRPAIAEFSLKGSELTGTFLTPSGDYRYLQGVMNGDSILLSCFDGSHAYLFTARMVGKDSIDRGVFYAGERGFERWTAHKDENATLEEGLVGTVIVPDASRVNFRFPDIDSNMVSFDDTRFRNKVVILQLMGSWCPNCMDEMKFLAEWYKINKNRGVEIIALAYEYSKDFQRSSRALRRMRDAFQVPYPLLITGYTVNDSLRTLKTLPQLNEIKAYPTLLIVGKDGFAQAVHTGFYGPGTGIHFEEFKKEFNSLVEKALK